MSGQKSKGLKDVNVQVSWKKNPAILRCLKRKAAIKPIISYPNMLLDSQNSHPTCHRALYASPEFGTPGPRP